MTSASDPVFDTPTLRILPSHAVLRIGLFRHGETVQGAERLCRGHADVPLSARGAAQSAAAAAWYRANRPKIDRVYSSDLQRCTELATQLDAPVVLDRRLREQDMGDWDGRSWRELTEADPDGTLRYWQDFLHARPPGGESYSEVYRRVLDWWNTREEVEGRVVIVTHVGVVRALLSAWLGLGPAQALRWAPSYTSLSEVLVAESGAVVEKFGFDPWAAQPSPSPGGPR